MVKNKEITVKTLTEKYKFRKQFFDIILCRSEFKKYQIGKSSYHNCYGFIFALEHVMRLKGHSDRCKLSLDNIDVVNYCLN